MKHRDPAHRREIAPQLAVDQPLITCIDLGQVYDSGRRRVAALGNVSLAIDRSEFVCVLGPSECGKTTLLNILAGFIAPSHGD